MKFISSRDRTIASLTGHSIEFKKGVPTFVPKEMHAEVLNLGCVPEEELQDSTDDKPAVEPTDPTERQDALLVAIALMVERNSRDDFGANGAPSIKALNDDLGWKPSAEERDTAWLEYQAKD